MSAVAPGSEYRVLYTLTRGEWAASVRGVRGCRARGKTLRLARRRLCEALARFDAGRPRLAADVRLPGDARRLLVRHWRATRKAERARQASAAAARAAAGALRALGLKPRDVYDLLGLTARALERVTAPRAGRRGRSGRSSPSAGRSAAAGRAAR